MEGITDIIEEVEENDEEDDEDDEEIEAKEGKDPNDEESLEGEKERPVVVWVGSGDDRRLQEQERSQAQCEVREAATQPGVFHAEPAPK